MKMFFYPTKRGASNKRIGWVRKGFKCSPVRGPSRYGEFFFRVHGINGFHRKGQRTLFYD